MRKFFLLFVVLVFLIFACSTVSSKRLYTWGSPVDISFNSDTNCLTSYDNFSYCFQSNGVFKIFKNGVQQARYGFGFSGTYNNLPQFALSSDYDWVWSVVSNNKDKIEVEGKRANYDVVPFKWKINLVLEKYAPLKISNFVENTTTKDVLDLNFFYLFDVNTSENPTVEYIDENGNVKNYSYHTNQLRADRNGLVGILNNVSVPFFNFQFQDLVDSNYFLTYLYFGNLKDNKSLLPDANGFIVGFSKGDGTLGAGKSHTIDPTIRINLDGDKFDGYLMYANGAFLRAAVDPSNPPFTTLSTGHETSSYCGSGKYCWDRIIVEFDLTGLNYKVLDAVFSLDYASKTINSETCSFDLNSIITVGTSIGSSDWSSTVFEKVVDDWFDDTIAADINADVTTAWNNNIIAGRNYLTFRIGMDSEDTFTNTSNDCMVTFRDTGGIGFAPYIQYTPYVDVTLQNPNGNQYLYMKDGNYLIDFNLSYVDSNYLYASIYYSATQRAYENLIVSDLNLHYFGANPTVDINCADNDFSNSTNCVYDWNFSNVTDGNYFIDLNIFSIDGNGGTDSSNYSFVVDKTKPVYSVLDFNLNGWNNFDTNLSFTCTDVTAGCELTKQWVRFDNDESVNINWLAWQDYDLNNNVFLSCGSNDDCNFAVQFYVSDRALNDSNASDDLNRINVLIDKIIPDANNDSNNNAWQNNTANVSIDCIDSNSGGSTKYYRLDSNPATATNFGSWQTYSSAVAFAFDGNYGLQVKCNDLAGNTSDTNEVYALIDKTPPTLSNLNPAIGSNVDTSNSTPTFSLIVSDAYVGVDSCRYIYYLNTVENSNGSVDASTGFCSFIPSALSDGDIAYVVWDANDDVNNFSTVSTSGTYTYTAPSGGNVGGGGGGGAIQTFLKPYIFGIEIPLFPLDKIQFPLPELETKTVKVIVKNTGSTFIPLLEFSIVDDLNNAGLSKLVKEIRVFDENNSIADNNSLEVGQELNIELEFFIPGNFLESNESVKTIKGSFLIDTIQGLKEEIPVEITVSKTGGIGFLSDYFNSFQVLAGILFVVGMFFFVRRKDGKIGAVFVLSGLIVFILAFMLSNGGIVSVQGIVGEWLV